MKVISILLILFYFVNSNNENFTNENSTNNEEVEVNHILILKNINFKIFSLFFLWLIFALETFLNLRQLERYTAPKGKYPIPKELVEFIDEKTHEKTLSYRKDLAKFGMIKQLFEQITETLIILSDLLSYIWYNIAGSLITERYLGYDDYRNHEIIHSLILVLIYLIYNSIISLPWDYYHTFVIEQTHGFNKQTKGFFLWDKIKSMLVSLVLAPLLIGPIIKIIHWGGEYFYIYVCAFILIFTLLIMTIYPALIAPLFDTYVELHRSKLRDKIEALANKLHYPLTKIFVVIASKRSAHSNAYLYGFYNNKRIVLFDTLLNEEYKAAINKKEAELKDKSTKKDIKDNNESEIKENEQSLDCTTDEILAILAHEFGHWQYYHTIKNLGFTQFISIISFCIFGQLMHFQPLFNSFGFYDSTPTIIGLFIVFSYIFSPINTVLHFCLTIISRRFEFQADAYSASLGHGENLKKALVKLLKNNLSDVNPDPLYSLYHYSHPPLVERLNAIKNKTE